MKNLEQELKLQLTQREYDILAAQTDAQAQLQSNFYFAYGGMPQTTMVRVRQKGDDFFLCYKKLLSQRDNVAVCDERQCELTAEHAGYILQRGVTVDEMRHFLDVNIPMNLALMGRLDTFRTKFALQDWNIELDKNQYLGVTDFELECENTDVLQLNKLSEYLYFTFGVVAKPSKPKSERFFEALNR